MYLHHIPTFGRFISSLDICIKFRIIIIFCAEANKICFIFRIWFFFILFFFSFFFLLFIFPRRHFIFIFSCDIMLSFHSGISEWRKADCSLFYFPFLFLSFFIKIMSLIKYLFTFFYYTIKISLIIK